MLSFSLSFHTFPPSLFLSSLTHTFTTFLSLSFTHSLLLLTHPTPTPYLPVLNHNFYLLPSIVRLSAVPAAQLKDAFDSLAQTIASVTEQVKKICPHLSYHHAPPLTPLPSHLPLSVLSPSSSASFFHFCLVHTFSPIYSHPSPPLYSLFSFYCPLPSCSKSSLSTTTSFSTTNCSSSLFFLLLHKIYFTLPSLSCLLSNHRPVHSKRDSVPVMSCYWQFRGYWRSKEMSSLPSTRAMITNSCSK